MLGNVPGSWFLEGYLDGGDRLWRTRLGTNPFIIGRGPGCDLVLPADGVSFHHAELQSREDGDLWVVDQGSRNGTFLNGRRLDSEARLEEGDLLRFANQEFRLGRQQAVNPLGGQTISLSSEDFEPRLLGQGRALEEMLRNREVLAFFQPLVSLPDQRVFGFEHLGRGRLEGEVTSPGKLFSIAEAVGLEARLNRLLREVGFEEAARLPPDCKLFINTHPRELEDVAALVASLESCRGVAPELDLVVEIHETAVTDLAVFRHLRQELGARGVDIAFDDFGTGQARLVELADATPRYLKFDVVWLSEGAGARRGALLQSLLGLAKDLGIETVLEGVETADQAQKAGLYGFDYAQGYFYGRPAPASTFL